MLPGRYAVGNAGATGCMVLTLGGSVMQLHIPMYINILFKFLDHILQLAKRFLAAIAPCLLTIFEDYPGGI